MLALRINTVLLQRFKGFYPQDTEECVATFLKKMARVERTEVSVDGMKKTEFLNLTPDLQETLKLINLSNLFESGTTG